MKKLTLSQWLKVIENSPNLKKAIFRAAAACAIFLLLVWMCDDYQYEEVIKENKKSATRVIESQQENEGINIKGEFLKYDEYYGRKTWMYLKAKKGNVRDYPDLKKSKVVDTYDEQGMSFAPLGMINDFYVMIPIYEGGENQFIHKSIVAESRDELLKAYISQGTIVNGMTKDQVRRAWGNPDTEYTDGNYASWKYDWHNRIMTIKFRDGIYTDKSEFKHNYDDL